MVNALTSPPTVNHGERANFLYNGERADDTEEDMHQLGEMESTVICL